MSIDPSRYPSNWKEISQARREQAGQKCEWCGVPNKATICRKRGTSDYLIEDLDDACMYKWPDGRWIKISELPEGYDYDKPTRVVLTVHHIGVDYPDGRKGNPHDKMDVRPENLVALCQRCHLAADMDIHVANARKTRLAKKQAQIAAVGQKSLFGDAS
jgi:hypothetical protein